jgi:uncharacterized protein YuzE
VILLVRGPDRRYIELRWDAWAHIRTEHFDLADSLEDIVLTIEHPDYREPDPVPGRERSEPGPLAMSVHMGDHEFDGVVYDAERDVLYLRRGAPRPARETLASPEGHAIRLNESGEIIGITVVNAKWLAKRDGQITVTVPDSSHSPERLETSATDLAPAFTP